MGLPKTRLMCRRVGSRGGLPLYAVSLAGYVYGTTPAPSGGTVAPGPCSAATLPVVLRGVIGTDSPSPQNGISLRLVAQGVADPFTPPWKDTASSGFGFTFRCSGGNWALDVAQAGGPTVTLTLPGGSPTQWTFSGPVAGSVFTGNLTVTIFE